MSRQGANELRASFGLAKAAASALGQVFGISPNAILAYAFISSRKPRRLKKNGHGGARAGAGRKRRRGKR